MGNSKLSAAAEERLQNQLIKLGDMLGDGDADPWVAREYRRTLKALQPEIFSEQRKLKADRVNQQVLEIISKRKCGKCNGDLKQSRSGSVILYCQGDCKSRYKLTKAKK